jgi:hypothetical protein
LYNDTRSFGFRRHQYYKRDPDKSSSLKFDRIKGQRRWFRISFGVRRQSEAATALWILFEVTAT